MPAVVMNLIPAAGGACIMSKKRGATKLYSL